MTTDLINTPTVAIAGTLEGNLRIAQEMAAAELALIGQERVRRAATDLSMVPTKTLIEMSESAFKISGLAKKQEEKAQNQRFSVQIILADGGQIDVGGAVINHDAAEEPLDVAPQLVESAPDFIENAPDIDFAAAPEFVDGQ